MKKVSLTIAAVLILLTTACQKDDEIQPASKKEITISDCNRCQGGWDLTDTIP